ncbi:hypothetical protein [Streptomyces sp. NPDC102437]|uniref:hypothetical protein n=1 Tax=Streptomyces sp. NPDC102437 TaxID=3366175 RepID=UPI0037FA1FCA
MGVGTTAAQCGIELDSCFADGDGNGDLAAFFGIDTVITSGGGQICAKVSVTAPAESREHLAGLVFTVGRRDRHAPQLDPGQEHARPPASQAGQTHLQR